MSKYSEYKRENLEKFVSSINSYLGLMRHYKSYKIRKGFIKKHIKDWIPHVLIGKNYQKVNVLKNRDK